MNWYIAESLETVIRHGDQVSYGRRAEGYELMAGGTLYMHKIRLSDDEVETLRQRVVDGEFRKQLVLPGIDAWYFSYGGKARWPGTSVRSRSKLGADGKWRPVPLTPNQLAQLNAS